MEERGLVRKIAETDTYFVYRIDDRFVFPYAYVGGGGFGVRGLSEELSSNIRAFRGTVSGIRYVKSNPKTVTLSVEEAVPAGSTVYLNEKYDALWEAVFVAPDGSGKALARDESVRFANGWKTGSGLEEGGRIEIVHKSYRWALVGLQVSVAALSFLTAFVVLTWAVSRFFARKAMVSSE